LCNKGFVVGRFSILLASIFLLAKGICEPCGLSNSMCEHTVSIHSVYRCFGHVFCKCVNRDLICPAGPGRLFQICPYPLECSLCDQVVGCPLHHLQGPLVAVTSAAAGDSTGKTSCSPSAHPTSNSQLRKVLAAALRGDHDYVVREAQRQPASLGFIQGSAAGDR
jgi:hypothetical protein